MQWVRQKVKAMLPIIEQWASQSENRFRLLVLLVWTGFGILAVLSTAITGWIMLPQHFDLF
jgi:hypothetical protein